MTMKKAWSVLQVKAVDDEERLISGIASTPQLDRQGDIVDPKGLKYSNPTPLLWQHKMDAPVGTVTFDAATEAGLTFTAHLPKVDEDGALKSRVDEAWQSIKHGLVTGVSIGFRGAEVERLKGERFRIKTAELVELSLVTVPANPQAMITAIKAIDAAFPPAAPDVAPADPDEDGNPAPAATGDSGHVVRLLDPARVRAPFVIRNIRRN